MSPMRTTGAQPQLLFKVTKGAVTGEIRGPRIGWRWRDVRYYRWQKSTKEATQWNRVLPTRPVDQRSLEQCVKEVRAWLKREDDELEAIHRPKV